jgi:hypothetical protein
MCDEKSSQLPIEATTKCNIECKNGGKCQINSAGLAKCQCESNLFKGDLCQIKVILDMCSNDHCLNGGSCLANGECLCPPGYAGERCQTKRLTSQCGLVTCYNGGTCFIDNQNEYACMCHHVFTGKFCETKFETTTTTKVNIQTVSSSSSKTTSTVKSTFLIIESTKHVTQKSDFSSQEIALIVLAGLGMPIFAILIVVLLYRINSNRKPNENMKQLQIENGRLSKIAVENIYVECNNGSKKATNQIKDSNTVIEIKDKKAQNDSFTNLKNNITQYTNEKNLNDNIYSIIDFSNENSSTIACALNAEEICKNFVNKHANLHEYQVTYV